MLSVYYENLNLILRDMAAWVEQPELKFSSVLLLCSYYRMRGIAALLLSAEPEPLFLDLHRSARAFVQGISKVPLRNRAAGRMQPFFDAVACEDALSAEAIARAAPQQNNPSYEYEEAYCYMRILMSLFILDDRRAAEQLMARYQELLSGRDEARSQLCRAFLADDSDLFARAFDRFLADYGDEWKQREKGSSATPEAVATEARLSIEALALLRFADRRQWPTLEEYPFVPSLCRR